MNLSAQEKYPGVKLSQCMIVKNEEKNIERALAWARDITYEQIVVDTGSTDRTVEIAESIGAKVYHFEWINDFSAARNHALEQATGDWILIIDADEYFPAGDAEKLLNHIMHVEADHELREKCIALSCAATNVDDNGRPMSTTSNVRMFRNTPLIRFSGRIHEQHNIDANRVVWMDDVRMIHTGYSETARRESGKVERNIKLLTTELENDPENVNLKAYLADSLELSSREADLVEADRLFAEVINSDMHVHPKLKIKAYVHFLNKHINNPDNLNECDELCRRALNEFPGNLDFEYFQASVLNSKREYRAAWDLLKSGEERLLCGDNLGAAFYVPADPSMIYGQLLLAAQGLGDISGIIMYATLMLKTDKTRFDILCPYIFTLINHSASVDELIGLLMSIYDLNDPKDLMFIARAAKDIGAVDLARMIMTLAGEVMGN